MKKHKKDIILFIGIIVGACILWGVFLLYSHIFNQTADQVVITIDGKEYGCFALNEDKIIEISDENDSNTEVYVSKEIFGKNTVVIKDGKVYMYYADCPDQYCVKHAPISDSSDIIVCLPHKLVVEVTQKAEIADGIDAIAE